MCKVGFHTLKNIPLRIWSNLRHPFNLWLDLSDLFCWIPESVFLFAHLLSFLCLLFWNPSPPATTFKSFILSFGVPFQIFYLYQCLLLPSQLRAGKMFCLYPLGRSSFFWVMDWGERQEAFVFPVMFQFLASDNWICSREWEREKVLFWSDVGNKDQWRPVLWFLPWHKLPLLYYVNLNSELFHLSVKQEKYNLTKSDKSLKLF